MQVAGHDLVYGELLIGDRGGRKKLLADLQTDSSKRQPCLTETLSPSSKAAACMGVASAGSMFSSWLLPLLSRLKLVDR